MIEIIFFLLTVLVLSGYLYVNHIYSYWERKNIPCLKPVFPFGNFGKNIFQKLSIGELTQEFHNRGNEPVLGFYASLRSSLLVRDPELIRNILVKDFSSFYHRGLYSNEVVDPLTGNLLFLNGEKWRALRSKLSPAFTTGKLKAMFSTLVDCGDSMHEYVAQFADTHQTIEVRDVFARYSTNVIASVAFGIDVDCIRKPDSEFRKYGKKIFEMTINKGIRAAITFLSPNVMSMLRIRATDKSVEDFMRTIVRENLEFREKNHIVRKDFFQLLIQLRNSGAIAQNDDEWKINADQVKVDQNRTEKIVTGKCLSLDEMTAQAFIFFAAGFETVSTTMSFCTYELAKVPEIQNKVHSEIDRVLAKYGGKLTYDSLHEMKYLEHCIDETLRMRPPLAMLTRQCTQNYQLRSSDLVIEKGTPILISILALHHDPKFWDDPFKFNPDRFDSDTKSAKTFAERPYFPFGEGPRNCIGMRMGKMQVKVGLVLMLAKFRMELAEEHIGKDLKYSPASVITAPITGIRLKVYRRFNAAQM